LAEAEPIDPSNAYPLTEFLADLKADVWGTPVIGAPDASRRQLQRVYIERLAAIVNPPPAPTLPPGATAVPIGPPPTPPPFVGAPNVPRSDLPALARAQLRQIREDARRGAATASQSAMARAHWQDIVDRIDDVLEAKRR